MLVAGTAYSSMEDSMEQVRSKKEENKMLVEITFILHYLILQFIKILEINKYITDKNKPSLINNSNSKTHNLKLMKICFSKTINFEYKIYILHLTQNTLLIFN